MLLFHDSQDIQYRNPFGAVPTATTVSLKLQVIADTPPKEVWLRLFLLNGQVRLSMELESQTGRTMFYQTDVESGHIPQLLWYDFIVAGEDKTLYYSNSEDGLGGVGQTTENPAANSYQITVYDRKFHTPAWFRDRIMYQIFPDRFFGLHGSEGIPKKREEYTIHYDWYEPLSFNQHPTENGPACNDFYGGNLKGIQEKLPYLHSLGVGILYLNPIFDGYSNHKYDTANYKMIDPMFGTEDDFRELCAESEKYGIRIILDGVFSHTGADSIYFNKYGNYGDNQGAYRDINSPYHPWYQFTQFPNYQSWWGCSNLPNVNEMEPSYLDYILRDKDSVIKKWVREGAGGWRLDVADELPDEFIQILRHELKKENPDAVIIGEVWEDASNKTAYGEQRQYLLGQELDSVMNYPFKDQVLGFLLGWTDAGDMNRRVMSQMENYPIEVLYSLMNILGTHDTMRAKSLLGGMSQNCGTNTLCSGMEDLATHRLMLGAFLQMTFYGVPCIYYGDEVGMQGGKDPFNRATYPWRSIDPELQAWYRSLGQRRNQTGCLRRGWFKPLFAQDDLYVYARYFKNGKDVFGEKGDNSFAICAVNRAFEPREAQVDLSGFAVTALTEVLTGLGTSHPADDGTFTLTVQPLGAQLYMPEKP